VYTWDLASASPGRLLELGANPYFTTMLLKAFGDRDLVLANFFNDGMPATGSQEVTFQRNGTSETTVFAFDHFNIESARFPYDDGAFSVVIFAEIIEHLLNDPLSVLAEIRRVLAPGGQLILTTPNVSRLENVARSISGANIYDPYSGYGPYGRHNREYNRHELDLLLRFAGFRPEIMFTADVHENAAAEFAKLKDLEPLLRFRENDLGQYIFVRAVADLPVQSGRPDFLFRSYPPGVCVPWPPKK
jgi:SAM-dependent methyltransferase